MAESRSDASPSRTQRVIVAGLLALLCAIWTRQHALAAPGFTSDFDQVWAAARALVSGTNPYAAVGPDAPFRWKWPLYYPMPAVLLVTPLSFLPVVYARAVFAGVGAGLFTFAISRDGWSRWPIFASVTFFVSVDLAQWSPYLAAGFFLPLVGVIASCKPNFAIPLAAGARELRTWWWITIGAVAWLAISFLVRPGWMTEWLANLSDAPHFIPPLARRGGFVLLLAILRWRRPEARWLLALACIPQAPSFYDQLLLVAICTRWWETLILTASTYALFFFVGANSPQPDYLTWGRLVGDATVWFCFLPMLAVVMLRPNEGTHPNVVERWRRLRGRVRLAA